RPGIAEGPTASEPACCWSCCTNVGIGQPARVAHLTLQALACAGAAEARHQLARHLRRLDRHLDRPLKVASQPLRILQAALPPPVRGAKSLIKGRLGRRTKLGRRFGRHVRHLVQCLLAHAGVALSVEALPPGQVARATCPTAAAPTWRKEGFGARRASAAPAELGLKRELARSLPRPAIAATRPA